MLLCLGLMPADDAGCFAADRPAASPYGAPAPQAKVDDDEFLNPPGPEGAAARQRITGDQRGAADRAEGRTWSDRQRDWRRSGRSRSAQSKRIEDQNVRNLEGNFRPQFQQLLYVELAFLRRCASRTRNRLQRSPRRPTQTFTCRCENTSCRGWARQRGRGGSNAADPRSEMQKLLMPLVEAKLGPEKARLYRQECDQRAEARKHAVVLNVVAALDERLVLTAQQRAKLVQSLSANYENAWDQCLRDVRFQQSELLALDPRRVDCPIAG